MKQSLNEEFRRMQKLAGLITESEFKQLIENKTLFTPSEMSDGDQIYVIEYNGKKFEFSYQEYDDAYICLEPWDNNVAQLFKYLKSEGVKAIIDVAPEKTIIIKKDEFEKLTENQDEQTISVSDVQEYVDSFDDEGILLDFNETFSGHNKITKSEFINFFSDYIDDMSEMKYIQAAWRKLSSGEGLY